MFSVRGKLSNKSVVKTGVSERGAWKIINFLIEKTRNKKKIKIPITAKGRLAEKIDQIALGEKIVVRFYIDGKWYNNKCFTECTAIEIEKYVPKVKFYANQIKPNDNDYEFIKDNNLFNYGT